MLHFYWAARCHMMEDSYLNSHRSENINFHM
jgi:hypothetical protein